MSSIKNSDDNDHPSSGNRKSGSSNKVGKSIAERSSGLFNADDWMCKSCGNINWARRAYCNMCNLPRIQKSEARTGIGGGYNEREAVEYNPRHESEDEYDEFGRKRKRKAKITEELKAEIVHIENKCIVSYSDENDDEEDDDDFDASKYALEFDSEENV